MISFNSTPFAYSPNFLRFGVCLAALFLIDFFVWHGLGSVSVGLSLATFGALGIWGLRKGHDPRNLIVSVMVLCLAVVPILIDFTLLSFCIGGFLTGISFLRLASGTGRLRGFALSVFTTLPLTLLAVSRHRKLEVGGALGLLRQWGLAAICVAGFGLLFVAANPVLEVWLDNLLTFNLNISFDVGRTAFWAGLAMILWPLSHLTMSSFHPMSVTAPQVGSESLRNTLIALNVLFAVQTATDLAILVGGTQLPQGMSMAEYVHRGAYPLLATALLAGGLSLLVRLQKEQSPILRMCLILWICQTISLVFASALRLDFYVQDFGLTHLRLWAAGWMAITGIGLGLLLVSIVRLQPVTQFLHRAAFLALISLYAATFVNAPKVIAHHNVMRLDQGKTFDRKYTCHLGPKAYTILKSVPSCYRPPAPSISGWRDWGGRNAIILQSAAQDLTN